MKKIILAATGEELEWRNDAASDKCLVRAADVGVPRTTLAWERILLATYSGKGGEMESYQGLKTPFTDIDAAATSTEGIEKRLLADGLIRIEETAEPQPGPTQEEYLIGEARAIILDAARNNFDHKRALRFIADSEGM